MKGKGDGHYTSSSIINFTIIGCDLHLDDHYYSQLAKSEATTAIACQTAVWLVGKKEWWVLGRVVGINCITRSSPSSRYLLFLFIYLCTYHACYSSFESARLSLIEACHVTNIPISFRLHPVAVCGNCKKRKGTDEMKKKSKTLLSTDSRNKSIKRKTRPGYNIVTSH